MIKIDKNYFKAIGKPKYISIEAVVTRADGSKENLGIVAERHFTFIGNLKYYIKKVYKWIIL